MKKENKQKSFHIVQDMVTQKTLSIHIFLCRTKLLSIQLKSIKLFCDKNVEYLMKLNWVFLDFLEMFLEFEQN